MYCGFCGREVEEGDKFCPYCGGRMEAGQDSLHEAAGMETQESQQDGSTAPPVFRQEDSGETQGAGGGGRAKKASTAAFLAVILIAAAVFFAVFFLIRKMGNSGGGSKPAETAAWEPAETFTIGGAAGGAPSGGGEVPGGPAVSEPVLAETAAEEPSPADSGIHRYEMIIRDSTWTEAWQDCLARGGYLVRFETPEEYAYVKGLLGRNYDKIKFWIGGSRPEGSYEYHWIGQDGVYQDAALNAQEYASLWMQGEPSFSDEGVQERFMNIFFYKKENRWVWNDVPDDIIAIVDTYAGTVGYICEYE